MDPALWSRLPLDILSVIIENTADSDTLETWREATKHSASLHHVAFQTSYGTFTICEKDILRAPELIRLHGQYTSLGDDEATECTPSGAKRPKYQMVFEPRERSYQGFAPYVRRLHLQFYFASSDRQEDLVRSEDVRHTFETILPYALGLQEIDHHGVLYQEELDCIVDVWSLKVLRVRQSWNDTPCSCSEGDSPRPIRSWALDWSQLFYLHALKDLSISQLWIYEAEGLGQAVKKLRKLESLRIEIAKIDVWATDALSDDDVNDLPLVTFIDALYRREEEHPSEDLGFPSSLKTLALVNVHYGRLGIFRLPNNLVTHLPNLTTLYLDLNDSKEVTDLFAFLNPHGLVHLLVSAYPKPEMTRMGSEYNACHHYDTFSGLLGQNSDTLREITLLNAWQDTREDGREIEPPWVSDMPLQRLYISKPSQRSGTRLHSRPQISARFWHLHGGLRFGEVDRKLWGKGVRHMRIDQLDLAKLKILPIDQAVDKFSQLKILVLRSLPEQVHYEPPGHVSWHSRYLYLPTGRSVLRSTPYPYLPFGPTLAKDMADLREGRMAMEIATQDLPSLRVIMVDEYRFWLQRGIEEDDHLNRGPKVWFLRHALEDPDQEAVILQTMDRNDWGFLADREDCLPEQAPKEQVHWATRLVYRARDERIEGQGS